MPKDVGLLHHSYGNRVDSWIILDRKPGVGGVFRCVLRDSNAALASCTKKTLKTEHIWHATWVWNKVGNYQPHKVDKFGSSFETLFWPILVPSPTVPICVRHVESSLHKQSLISSMDFSFTTFSGSRSLKLSLWLSDLDNLTVVFSPENISDISDIRGLSGTRHLPISAPTSWCYGSAMAVPCRSPAGHRHRRCIADLEEVVVP